MNSKTIVSLIKTAYIVLSSVFFILLLIEHDIFILELIISAAIYITTAGILVGLGYYTLSRCRLVLSGAIICTFSLFFILLHTISQIAPKQNSTEPGNDLSILQLNVFVSNNNKLTTAKRILKEEPHIVTLHETSYSWNKKLDAILGKVYKYTAKLPGTYFGIAVYSKYPVLSYQKKMLNNASLLIAEILINKKAITLVTYHPYPPVNNDRVKTRNRQILSLINIINHIRGPKIITGDFNAVPWSWIMTKFKNELSIADSRSSINNTYPSYGFFKVPIDYIMHSEHFIPQQCKSLLFEGSDHLGVLTRYRTKGLW